MSGLSIAERLQQRENRGLMVGTVISDNPRYDMSKKVNNLTNRYAEIRNDDIRNSLQVDGYDKIVSPSDAELTYVNSVFQSKGFTDINNISYEDVELIGKAEFNDLNEKMKVFTRKMGDVKTVGIYGLIDDLSKSVNDVDMEAIWNKAVNAKPSLWVIIMSFFNPKAKDTAMNKNFAQMKELLSTRGRTLETKLVGIEKDLESQKKTQESNIRDLESSFTIYYESFTQLRKQFALIVYLEHKYKQMLEDYKNNSSQTTDLSITAKLSEYESRLDDITNKRLIIHKTMMQLPIIVEQNKNLIGVCKTLMKEINNTLVSSFPMIRSNLQTIGVSIMTQQAMIGNNASRDLEENLSTLASEVTGKLALQGATMSADARLREANNVKTLVGNLKTLQDQLLVAKDQSRQKMDSATSILTDATNELKDLLT